MLFHVIEDELILREVMDKLIMTEGYNSISFESAEAYLDFRSWPQYFAPAAIIIDNRMPGMNGSSLVKHIRKESPFQRMIITTATPGDIETARKELCYELPKPCRYEQFQLLLRAVALCEKYNIDSTCGSMPKCSFGLDHPCPFYKV